ncbi:hypothetical protein RvY_11614 [Ramazzottius varieornatus]|uniref:Rap-GAP domain-containing protein n=1 Tax=Ramazzottius varieornatus TaxID=947166 RepID=A0A1D1VM37_RAMVA|nr:hypothetical protein RvY_11614 [Ramazzottius varieornatus]
MSATVVDPSFYYQHMRQEMPVSGNAAPPYREGGTAASGGYARSSPRVAPRQLGPVVRAVYDDRSLSGGTNAGPAALPPSKSQHVKYADAEIIANPLAKRAYYRSVSSLDISLEEDDTPRPTLLKEYSGSASSIDLGKTVGGNIRAILEQLRHGKTVNGSANSLSSLPNSDGSGGSGSGSGFLCNARSKKSKVPKKSSLRSRSSIFRKMRGGSQNDMEIPGVDVDSLSAASTTQSAASDAERIRRKIFAHFDSQSLLTKLVPPKDVHAQGLRRNTTTGASAANFTTRIVLPSQSDGSADSGMAEDIDQGDGKSNQLLLNCPYFRNEIHPEDCSPSVSPSAFSGVMMRRPARQRPLPSAFRPHYGSLVLEEEEPVGGQRPLRCAHQMQPRFEHLDHGALYYRKYFHEQAHSNYFGVDEKFGPVAVSIKKEKTGDQNHKVMYRLIVRTTELSVLRGGILEDSLPRLNKEAVKPKDLLDCVVPELQTSCLRLGSAGVKTEDILLKLDEQAVPKKYKVGVMYCKAGQCTEEEMYNNETSSPAFDEFLDLLGQRVRLKGFEKYRAQLDNKSDSTGLYSLYTTFHEYEIMFHVSTMLPFTPSNKQQLLRKRHIGNDIVTIVFQEPGALPFSPKTIRSHFQHVFIVVQVQFPNTDRTQYLVSISRSKDVPPFGPPLPESATFSRSTDFVDFILTKVINAENAAHKSEKFAALATRTRLEYLKDLAANYVTHTSIESSFGKLTMFSLSTKKRDKPLLSYPCDGSIKGALSWSVQAKAVDMPLPLDGRMLLGISTSFVVLVDPSTGAVVKFLPNSNIMGWKSQEESLSLYYHVGESIQMICGTADDWKEIMQRLKAVTSGIGVVDLTLTRNIRGHLGFHTQFNGLITDVDTQSIAYKAGLRRGSCLLEVCGQSVSMMDHETLADLLRRANPVTVTLLPPLDNGLPRRGCNRPLCIRAPEHAITSTNYDNLSDSMESVPQAVYVQPVASRSSSSMVDGHVAFFIKSDSSQQNAKVLPSSQVSTSPPRSDFAPTLDYLEAESRWWANQMTEETNRLNRLIPQTSPVSSTSPLPLSVSPQTARSLPVPSANYATISQTVDLRPTKPFERKLSPNSAFPLFDSGTDTMSSTTSKSSSRSQRGTGGTTRTHLRHHKTDPGFGPPPQMSAGGSGTTAVRNSPTKSSLKKTQERQNGSLQEELLKLINPDLIDRDSRAAGLSVENIRRGSEGPSRTGNSSHGPVLPGAAQPATMSKSLEALTALRSEIAEDPLAWNTLVHKAERAARDVNDVAYAPVSSDESSTSPDGPYGLRRSSPPPVRPRSSSRRHHSRPVSGEFQPDRFVSAERIQELEDRITRLIYDLNREREDRMALETQVRQLTFSRHRGHEN